MRIPGVDVCLALQERLYNVRLPLPGSKDEREFRREAFWELRQHLIAVSSILVCFLGFRVSISQAIKARIVNAWHAWTKLQPLG